MDGTTFYRLGQIRHQEVVQEAEQQRLAASLRMEPTLWQRIGHFLSAHPNDSPAQAAACGDAVALNP